MKSKALQKLLNTGQKGNPLDRLADLEQKSMGAFLRNPSALKLTDITNDLGTLVQGEFIAPAASATSAEPTDTGFTGVFMSGNGYTFNGTVYHWGIVASGVLQVGGNDVAEFLAGAGAVSLDVDGIVIQTAVSPTYPNRVNWVNGASLMGNIGVDSSGNMIVSSASIDITSGAQLNLDGSITTNPNNKDLDLIIKGDAATIATFDAGLDAVGFGGAAESGKIAKFTGDVSITGDLAVGGINYPTSGSYSPTGVSVSNLDSLTLSTCYYTRIGNNVHVWGSVVVDPTATATLTKFGVPLPISSNLTAVTQASGNCGRADGTENGTAYGDTTNDRVEIAFVSASTASHGLYFQFDYVIA